MNKNEPSDTLNSLIRDALPEMSRIRHAAEVGFDTRLRAALGPQESAMLLMWEAATRSGLRVAACLTVLIVVEAGFWLSPRIGHGFLKDNLTVETLLLDF